MLAKKEILYEEFINWPDGIFYKVLGSKLNKILRDIIRKLRIFDHINEITIMGNLSKNSTKYLQKRFKRKLIIFHFLMEISKILVTNLVTK